MGFDKIGTYLLILASRTLNRQWAVLHSILKYVTIFSGIKKHSNIPKKLSRVEQNSGDYNHTFRA